MSASFKDKVIKQSVHKLSEFFHDLNDLIEKEVSPDEFAKNHPDYQTTLELANEARHHREHSAMDNKHEHRPGRRVSQKPNKTPAPPDSTSEAKTKDN